MTGRVTYHFTRPDAATLNLVAFDGKVTFASACCDPKGRTPAQLANTFYGVAQRHLILSRAADVTADWPHESRPDRALWQRFRDVIAQMPRRAVA